MGDSGVGGELGACFLDKCGQGVELFLQHHLIPSAFVLQLVQIETHLVYLVTQGATVSSL